MTEQWIPWTPIENLAQEYDIEYISESYEGLKIVLFDVKDSNKKVQLLFEESILSYRSTDESFRCKLMYDISEKYGKEALVPGTFFKVEHSTYIQWLSEQSNTISDSFFLTHFSLIAKNYVFDVIATCEPKIIMIDLS